MQNNTSKINTFLLIVLVVLAFVIIWMQWHDRRAEEGKNMGQQAQINVQPDSSQISDADPNEQNGNTQNISTTLPQYISAQEGWPPVIQTSATAYSCTPTHSEMTDTVQKVINGKTYCVTTFIEGAAGSSYSTYTYTTAKGSGTKTTKFTLRSGCGGYGGPGEAQYDQCKSNQKGFFEKLDSLIASLM